MMVVVSDAAVPADIADSAIVELGIGFPRINGRILLFYGNAAMRRFRWHGAPKGMVQVASRADSDFLAYYTATN